jgi:hypothetical protein
MAENNNTCTGTPARVMGQDHRIGQLIEGFDAGNSRIFFLELVFSLLSFVYLDVVVRIPSLQILYP